MIHDNIEDWKQNTSELRKRVFKNILDLKTGGDPQILINSQRLNSIIGGVKFKINLGKKYSDKEIRDFISNLKK
jgi:frataxin-like iron-binding protein CyaY